MQVYKILPVVTLAPSFVICAWLVLRPSALQRYFAERFEQQGQPLSAAITKGLWGVPPWAIRIWGAFAFVAEIFIVLAIIYFVDSRE